MHSICPRRPLPRLPHGFGARSGRRGLPVSLLELMGLSLTPSTSGPLGCPSPFPGPCAPGQEVCPVRLQGTQSPRAAVWAAQPPGTPPTCCPRNQQVHLPEIRLCRPTSRRATPQQEARRPSLGRDIGCGVGTGPSGGQSTRRLSLEQVGESATCGQPPRRGPLQSAAATARFTASYPFPNLGSAMTDGGRGAHAGNITQREGLSPSGSVHTPTIPASEAAPYPGDATGLQKA